MKKPIVGMVLWVALLAGVVVTPAAELLGPGLPVVGVAAAPGSAVSALAMLGTAAGVNNYPAAEAPDQAIDGVPGTKYLNFAKINTGLIVTIPGQTTVTGFVFTAANDAPERDPVTVTIEGTSAANPAAAAAGATWTLLYSGPSGLAADPGRFLPGATLAFPNGGAFNTYRVLVTSVRNEGSANSMQFSEVQFLGTTTDTTAPTIVNTTPLRGSVVRSLFQIEVFFSEPVDGVDAADLQVNGVPATGIIYAAPNQFAFDFPAPPTGTVTITFAPNHGIQDQAPNPNVFAGDTWTYTLDPNAGGAQVVINEFMASNDGTLHDEDGDSSDWIELYNAGSTAANLDGYYLTDAANNLTKWRIPSVTMAANSYLVIFASGKNRTNNPAKLHTNFQLSPGGEYLALVGPTTNVLSDFAPEYPAQQTDVSYGRDRVNPTLVGYFATPTPGAVNATSGAGFAPEVQFSRDSGTFVLGAPFLLTLSTPVTNAAIYYTLGTNLPTTTATNSFLYTNAIAVTNSTLIQARAFQTNRFPGPIATKSYIALTNQTNILSFRSTLPIMILHDLGRGPVTASKERQLVVMQTFEPKGGFSSLTNPPDHAEGGSFHVRGSSTAVGSSSGKSGFFLKIQDAFQDKKTIELLGLPNESDWVLYAPNNFEPALIHNPLAHNFARQQGEYASRTRFFELYLKDDTGTPGAITAADYHGVMVLEEKIKRDKNRVDIAKLEPEHRTAPEVTGGYMFSIDRIAPGETQLSAGGAGLNWIEPDYEDMILPARAPQVAYIQNYFNNFGTALNGANWTNPVTGYAAYIDVDSWVRRHIHEVITFNVDALRLSGYLYKDRDKKIEYGPAWDYDRTQGSTDGRDFNPRVWASGGGTDFFNFTPWWGRLFQSPDFWQRWIDRYQDFRETVYNPTNVNATIDAVTAEVREAEPRELARWNNQPRQANGNSGGTYATEIQWKKNWYSNRLDFIDTNFLARPRLNITTLQNSSAYLLTLTGPAGAEIYYTLTGDDPRASGGAIAPGSVLYSGPILVSSNTRLVARALDPGHRNQTGALNPPITSPWSGPIAQTFVINTPALVITELMYHPAPPVSQSDTNDADNFEYIELKNVGSTTLNLVGFRFTNGIDFTFTATNGVTSLAPGGYVLLVKNLTSFILRYGAQPNIAGQYEGNLDNSGERLTLVGPRLEPILDFTYSDGWYPLSDGFGWSLVVRNENAPLETWGDKDSWRVSSSEGGSPGVANPPPSSLPVVLVNEALTHTDFPVLDQIELFNSGASEANIGGWYLTDDANDPKKYQIPANTMVPAGGFILFDESQFTNGPTGFSLSSDGDELYLFSATNGLLTGYAHGVDFGAAQNGVTFGRYVTSQGDEEFVAQSANTLGTANALPLVGPVVISEIMYHPQDTLTGLNNVDNALDEFIELYNLTGTNVPLYHVTNPSNTWRLTQAVSFDFPTNVSLAPTSFVLVVNFDPTTNAAQLAAFRARYGVSNSIPIFGPYGGKLDNSSENIRLSRPDHPNTNGAVPYILVDRVEYQDGGAWPESADGLGASLQRLVLSAYGNDPTNWTAATPTAGTLFPGGTRPAITQQPAPATVLAAGAVAVSPLYVVGTTSFVAVASGPGLRYQWRFNNTALPGATNATLVLTDIQHAHAGSYSVLAYNAAGSVISSNAQLTVYSPLAIVVQPASQNVPVSATVNLGILAVGVGPLRYQWRFEGVDIAGATNFIYSYSGANITLNGNYSCRVEDDFGSLVSSNAFIYAPPVSFTLQPASQSVLPSTNVTISAQAVGFGPVRYQWQYEGADIPNATNASYSFTNASLATHGNYRVIAFDDLSTALSSNAFIFVLVKPGITVHPVPQTVLQGGTARFSAIATGAPPIYYRWLRNGSLWASNLFPDLVITNCQSNGTFRLTVGNLAGTAGSVPAAGVALTVLRDFDGDGMADIWETNYPGFSTNNAADALLDFDGDGMINRDEFVAGTNPTDGLSYLKVEPLTFQGGNAAVLQFAAVSNRNYTIDFRDSLNAPWTNLFAIPATTNNRTLLFTNLLITPMRVYRVGIPGNN